MRERSNRMEHESSPEMSHSPMNEDEDEEELSEAEKKSSRLANSIEKELFRKKQKMHYKGEFAKAKLLFK